MKLLYVRWMSIILNAVLSTGTATDVTRLESNIPEGEACIGEYVAFTCTTTTFSLRWTVRAQSSAIQPQTAFFHHREPPGTSINISESGFDLRFELVSFTTNPVNLTSILVARASAVLDYGTIECRAASTETLTFRILSGFSGSPTNIEISDKVYGDNSSNVTLIWTPPTAARRLAHYRVQLLISSETVSKQLTVNATEVRLEDIPYNEEATVSISAVNDCSGESGKLNFTFIIYGCTHPNTSTPANAVLHNTSELVSMLVTAIAPGEVVTFACKYISEPYYHVHICQENGLWYPDPSTVSCPNNCQIPILNDLVEVEIINSTVQLQGSNLTLHCKEGFTPTRPHLGTMVCSSNGTWIPNPDNYECRTKFINWKGNCGRLSVSCLGLYAVIGASAGFLICGVSCGIALASVKKWKSWKARIRQSTYQDTSMMGPVYDTIDPAYEIVHQVPSNVTDMAEMTDNAAYLITRKFVRIIHCDPVQTDTL